MLLQNSLLFFFFVCLLHCALGRREAFQWGKPKLFSNIENNPETLTKAVMDINICGLCGVLGWRKQDRVSMGSSVEAPVAPGPGQPFILYILYTLHPLFMNSCCGFRLLKIFTHPQVYVFSLTCYLMSMDFQKV